MSSVPVRPETQGSGRRAGHPGHEQTAATHARTDFPAPHLSHLLHQVNLINSLNPQLGLFFRFLEKRNPNGGGDAQSPFWTERHKPRLEFCVSSNTQVGENYTGWGGGAWKFTFVKPGL